MFPAFENHQLLEPKWNPLFQAAKLQLRFLGRGEELQLVCGGERVLSLTLNSKPFVYSLPLTTDYEVTIGFGKMKKEGISLRQSIGGKFDSLSADEDVNQLRLPGVEIPTLLVFVQKPFTSEKAVFGFQFMGQIPAREIPVDVDNPSQLDKDSFRRICESLLGIKKEF